jgi:hypothetical protein
MEGATALTPLEIKFRFWMEWYVAHQPQIRYAEVRPSPLNTRLPMVDDCSGTYTNVRYLAGTVDPNGPSCPMVGHYKEFDGFGNTDSLAIYGQLVDPRRHGQLEIGDAVIYYNGYGWTPEHTVHVAMIYDPQHNGGIDPMTMSHGWSGEPAFVPISRDGRPHQFFKFPNTLRNPPVKHAPKLPVAKGTPTAHQLAAANLVGLKNPAHEKIARSHGWTIWYFSEGHTPNPFVPLIGGLPNHIPLYANAAYMMMR